MSILYLYILYKNVFNFNTRTAIIVHKFPLLGGKKLANTAFIML